MNVWMRPGPVKESKYNGAHFKARGGILNGGRVRLRKNPRRFEMVAIVLACRCFGPRGSVYPTKAVLARSWNQTQCFYDCAFISYIGGLRRRGTGGTKHMHNNFSNVWGTFLSNRTCNTLLCDQATLFHVALQIRGGCFTPSMPKSTVPSVVLKLAARCVHHTLAAQSEPNDKNTSRGAGLLHHPASPWIDGKSESRLGKAGGRVNSSGGAVELWSPEERQGSLSVEEL